MEKAFKIYFLIQGMILVPAIILLFFNIFIMNFSGFQALVVSLLYCILVNILIILLFKLEENTNGNTE